MGNHETEDRLLTTPLGPPKRKDEAAKDETWKPLPDNKNVLVSSKDGRMKTVDFSTTKTAK